VRATLNLCRANLLAMRAIARRVAAAVFVQSESVEYTHPARPEAAGLAEFHNQRRFLPLDLTYGRRVAPAVFRYLDDNGMEAGEYDFFMQARRGCRCVLGTDYYVTNEHLLRADGTTAPAGDILGYHVLARQYYERYGLPLMHTETNRWDKDDAAGWLWKQWSCLLRLRQDGVPVLGFTWYSLTDQMDWDTALRKDDHKVNTVGLFDLDRRPRTVGRAYGRLVREWGAYVAGEETAGQRAA
jgi:hypothetical protein